MRIAYLITNTVNGKRYVGKTEKDVAKRWLWHVRDAANGSRQAIHRAIRKYGHEKFTMQVLSVAGSEEHLNFLERYFIREFKSRNSRFGYNMTEGGDGVVNPSKESRAKLSDSMRGNTNGLGNRSRTGQRASNETRSKLSAAKIGNHNNDGCANFTGHRHSDESKAAMAAKTKARWNDPEFREKVLAALARGRKKRWG